MYLLFVILAVCQHFAQSTPESDALLDSLLAADGITLLPAALAIRREIFELSFLTKEEGEDLSLEAMYTNKEKAGQNGAVPERNLLSNAELQKREESLLAGMSTPSAYDGRQIVLPGTDTPLINPAQNQMTCGNCYLHTFLAALEIGYAKATGERVKFSEQEMTDCYFKGCNGGDYRMVSTLMSYVDKISSRKEYGDYLDGKYTCRQATTPDALEKVKITGYIDVTPATVEAAIVYYGSVMTCMEWGSEAGTTCRMDNYKKGKVVDYPEVYDGCAHAVLIVGYTPDHYIVRNSHGTGWGDSGYFLIKRGTNSCGIEQTMASITMTSRSSPKALAKNKCPADKPTYCSNIPTCIAAGETCVKPQLEVEKREEEEEELVKRYSRSLQKREEKKRPDKGWFVPGNEIEKREAEQIEVEKRCADIHGNCAMIMERLTCNHPTAQKYCAKSCGKCGASTDEVEIPKKGEKKGSCIAPKIANGKVLNKPIMRYSEKLKVECDSGYVLTGNPVYCLIQNVFTNSQDKDARLMPECIKINEGEQLKGNGGTYSGSKNTYKDTRTGQVKPCDSWKKDVLEGQLMGVSDGDKYDIGNHNFCRNPTGEEPVPMCLAMGEKKASQVYCFAHPGCDACSGSPANVPAYGDAYCESARAQGMCNFIDSGSKEQIQFYWNNCLGSCCAEHC